jgi:putative effector of murein hydrolase
MAKNVVTFIQRIKAIKTITTGTLGAVLGTLLIKRLTRVTATVIAAKGNSEANPHPSV